MKLQFVVIVISLFLFNCRSFTDKKQELHDEEAEVELQTEIADSIFYVESDSNYVFRYEDDKIIQILKFIKKQNELIFMLSSENKMTGNLSKIKGVAVTSGGDYEVEEDETGNAYPAIQYIYEGDCWLSFKIDATTFKKLKIKEANCNDYHYKDNPFESAGPMYEAVEGEQ